jgi:hypothetical protein
MGNSNSSDGSARGTDPVGVISKLAPGNREIACWEGVREILMVALRQG